MSLYTCPTHGNGGPTACCGEASRVEIVNGSHCGLRIPGHPELAESGTFMVVPMTGVAKNTVLEQMAVTYPQVRSLAPDRIADLGEFYLVPKSLVDATNPAEDVLHKGDRGGAGAGLHDLQHLWELVGRLRGALTNYEMSLVVVKQEREEARRDVEARDSHIAEQKYLTAEQERTIADLREKNRLGWEKVNAPDGVEADAERWRELSALIDRSASSGHSDFVIQRRPGRVLFSAWASAPVLPAAVGQAWRFEGESLSEAIDYMTAATKAPQTGGESA